MLYSTQCSSSFELLTQQIAFIDLLIDYYLFFAENVTGGRVSCYDTAPRSLPKAPACSPSLPGATDHQVLQPKKHISRVVSTRGPPSNVCSTGESKALLIPCSPRSGAPFWGHLGISRAFRIPLLIRAAPGSTPGAICCTTHLQLGICFPGNLTCQSRLCACMHSYF